MSVSAGKRIGQYELRQLLGQGGMGEVYRAIDVVLNRSVALKLMHSQFARQQQFRQRFTQEAQAIAALDHPNIIKVFAFHAAADEMYLVMEFIGTGSLRAYLRQQQADNKRLEVLEALRLTRQVASALHYAHSQHMIHRDVKPDNVLLKLSTLPGTGEESFVALLTDFGLVKLAENAQYQTQGNVPMGTLAYMSPEQIRGSDVDARTDIYALGIMLYELIAGQPPFKPQNLYEAAHMHINEPPPLLTTFRPEVSPGLASVIMRAIAKDPQQRFQTGIQMIQAIQQIESGEAELLTRMDTTLQGKEVKVENMSTYLASLPGVPLGADVSLPAAPSSLGTDRLVIRRAGTEARFLDLTKGSYIIGREGTVDIQLASKQISRQHAKIERRPDGVYTITDLGSTNKTFIDGVPLLSHVAEPWLAGQVVSVGEFRLALQLAQSAAQTPYNSLEVGRTEFMPAPPSMYETAQSMYRSEVESKATAAVQVQMIPPHVNLVPGSSVHAQIKMVNTSRNVEHFRVAVQGIPSEWVAVPPTPLPLMPGAEGMLPVTFNIPRIPNSTAGTHNLGLRITSEERGIEVARGTATLTVQPYYQYTSDMVPSRVEKGRAVRMTIANKGNAPDSYTISGRDREAAVLFDPPTQSLTVNAGQSAALEFYVEPRNQSLLGRTRTFPLELHIASTSGVEQRQVGELVAKPTFPMWLAGAATLLCLGLVAALALVMSSIGGGGDKEDAPLLGIVSDEEMTATRQAEILALTQEVSNLFGSQTANAIEALQAANVQTQEALAQTQVAFGATLTQLAAATNTPTPTITPSPTIPSATPAPTLTTVPSATTVPSLTPLPTLTHTPPPPTSTPTLFVFPSPTPTTFVFDPGVIVTIDPGIIIPINPGIIVTFDPIIIVTLNPGMGGFFPISTLDISDVQPGVIINPLVVSDFFPSIWQTPVSATPDVGSLLPVLEANPQIILNFIVPDGALYTGVGEFATTFPFERMVTLLQGEYLTVCMGHSVTLSSADVGRTLVVQILGENITTTEPINHNLLLSLELYRDYSWAGETPVDLFSSGALGFLTSDFDFPNYLSWPITEPGEYLVCLNTYASTYFDGTVTYNWAQYSVTVY